MKKQTLVLKGLFITLTILGALFLLPSHQTVSAQSCNDNIDCGPTGECVGKYCPTVCDYNPQDGQYDLNCKVECTQGTCQPMYTTTSGAQITCYSCNRGFCSASKIQAVVSGITQTCPPPNNCNDCSGGSSGTPSGPQVCGLSQPTVQTQKAPYSNTYQVATPTGTCSITITHQLDDDGSPTAWPGGAFGGPNYLSDSALAGNWAYVNDYLDDVTSNKNGWRQIYYTDAGGGLTVDNSGNKCGGDWNGRFVNDWSASSGNNLIIKTTGNNTGDRPHYMGYSLQASGCIIAPATDPTNCSSTIPFSYSGWSSGNTAAAQNNPANYSPGVAICGEGISYGACTPNSWGVGFGTTMDTSSTFPSKDTSWGSTLGWPSSNTIDPNYQYWTKRSSGTNPTDYEETNTKTFNLAYCGNGVCDSSASCGGENPSNCPQDCSGVTGALNTPSCTTGITGWAYDPNSGSTPVKVDIYADGNYLETATADIADSSLAGKCPGSTGGDSCGFSAPVPASLADSTTHSITAKAVSNESGTAVTLLPGSPQPLTCSSVPPAPGAFSSTLNSTCVAPGPDGQPEEDFTWAQASNMVGDPNNYYQIYTIDSSGYFNTPVSPKLYCTTTFCPTSWSGTFPNILPHQFFAYEVLAVNGGGSTPSYPTPSYYGTTNTCDTTAPPAPAFTPKSCYKPADWSAGFDITTQDTIAGPKQMQPPVYPPNSSYASGVQTVSMELDNNSGSPVATYTYSKPATSTNYPFPLAPTPATFNQVIPSGPEPPAGDYTFKLKATDFAGNTTLVPSTTSSFLIDPTCNNPFFQTNGGDVHSNGGINTRGIAPPPS